MKVYLDNAATTKPDERVAEAMMPFIADNYGNPSSIHSHGRQIRSAVEQARRTVADILTAAPAEIFFTSGGTEANNTIIRNAVASYGINTAITSKIEHHAVLHTLEHLEQSGMINLRFVDIDERGCIDYQHLEKLLNKNKGAFVSLMHANNEIGNIYDLERIGSICRENEAFFHSDTVQSIGHIDINLASLPLHAIVASAHKFHGPKGVGMMYINASKPIPGWLIGGGQERNMRGGTENVPGIIGLAKAMEIADTERRQNTDHLQKLKRHTISEIRKRFPTVIFNGESGSFNNSLHKILSLSIPGIEDNDMMLFNLDINGISLSGGSACASGTSIGSHVLDALNPLPNTGALRVSFSKYNSMEEIDFFVDQLAVALIP
jgi:cysteine desulfurase